MNISNTLWTILMQSNGLAAIENAHTGEIIAKELTLDNATLIIRAISNYRKENKV